MSNLIVLEPNTPTVQKLKPIVFISDLHLDFIKGKPNSSESKRVEDEFIHFVKNNYQNHLLCLAGDYYDDYRKTLSFVKRLEENKVTGFFVLGNHDFWNDGTMSYSDIIDLFITETQNHHHFKFLTTGKKYYCGDLCIIGDTGWTSFKRDGRQVNLSMFKSLPEALLVKGFSPKKILKMHKKWVSFANKILKQESNVLMVTHFPMVDFTEKDQDCWWSSTTDLIEKDSWRIFGHTHSKKQKYFNNISSQRGYYNYSNSTSSLYSQEESILTLPYEAYLKRFHNILPDFYTPSSTNQYESRDFGKLIPVMNTSSAIATYGIENLKDFYNPAVISKNDLDLSNAVLSIRKRGYKRCAANKHNFAALAMDPVSYLEKVKHIMDSYLTDSCIGYLYSEHLPYHVIEAIYQSIRIIENGNVRDVRSYMTAAVITGYVYNNMAYGIKDMRPLDDYDIMRFWMMFLTIQCFGIDAYCINSVLAQKKKKIEFQNVELYLPAVNDLSLEVEQVLPLLQQTTLLINSNQLP